MRPKLDSDYVVLISVTVVSEAETQPGSGTHASTPDLRLVLLCNELLRDNDSKVQMTRSIKKLNLFVINKPCFRCFDGPSRLRTGLKDFVGLPIFCLVIKTAYVTLR